MGGFVQLVTNILNQPSNQDKVISLLRSAFLGEKNHNVSKYVQNEIEKHIIKGFFESMETDKERKAFIEKYNKQVIEDRKTVARWHEIQKVEQSGMSKTGQKYRDAYEEAVINKDGSLVNPIPDNPIPGLDASRPLFTDRREPKTEL